MAAATTFPWFSAIKSVFVVANVRRLYPSGVEESIAQSMDENLTNPMANEETKQRFIAAQTTGSQPNL